MSEPMVFSASNEKAVASVRVPTRRPLYRPKADWQASSYTSRLCFLANATIGSMSQTMPVI